MTGSRKSKCTWKIISKERLTDYSECTTTTWIAFIIFITAVCTAGCLCWVCFSPLDQQQLHLALWFIVFLRPFLFIKKSTLGCQRLLAVSLVITTIIVCFELSTSVSLKFYRNLIILIIKRINLSHNVRISHFCLLFPSCFITAPDNAADPTYIAWDGTLHRRRGKSIHSKLPAQHCWTCAKWQFTTNWIRFAKKHIIIIISSVEALSVIDTEQVWIRLINGRGLFSCKSGVLYKRHRRPTRRGRRTRKL